MGSLFIWLCGQYVVLGQECYFVFSCVYVSGCHLMAYFSAKLSSLLTLARIWRKLPWMTSTCTCIEWLLSVAFIFTCSACWRWTSPTTKTRRRLSEQDWGFVPRTMSCWIFALVLVLFIINCQSNFVGSGALWAWIASKVVSHRPIQTDVTSQLIDCTCVRY